MKRSWIPLATIFLLLEATAATAAPIFTNSRAAVAGTDYVDWGALGVNGTVVSNPFSVFSSGGLNVQVSQTIGSTFKRLDQGSGWNGNFPAGSKLLYTSHSGGTSASTVALIDFGGLGVVAGGANVQANYYGAFIAQIELFGSGGISLGVFSQNGSSSPSGGTAPFLGFYASPEPVHQVAFWLTSAAGGTVGDYAINRFDFTPAPPPPPDPPPLTHTPEPASILAWLIVAAAALSAVRHSP